MKTTQKGFIIPLLLIIVAILLAGGGAYFYTQNKSENPPVTENVWKTYRSDKYGFEIKYPRDEIKISENETFYPFGPNIVFPANNFQVVLDKTYKGDFADYLWWGILRRERVTPDGFNVYSTMNSSVPFIAFAKPYNGAIYYIEFHGDDTLDSTEKQILTTFKFYP